MFLKSATKHTNYTLGIISAQIKEASERFGDLAFLDSLVVTDQ